MTTEQTESGLLPKEGTDVGLPPEVFPYKKESKIYVSPQGTRLLDVTFEERLANEEKKWWEGRYRDKVPRRWLIPSLWAIENYIKRTSRAKLQENKVYLEAIAAYPLDIHPFSTLANKLPLSKELLALGFVNSLSKQPFIKASILEKQRRMGVKPEVLEEAQKLAAHLESQQKSLT